MVTVTQRYLSMADTCPECGGGIRIAVAISIHRMQVYRLECITCDWVTDALPDPHACK